MDFWQVLLLVISTNFDDLSVGFSFGLKGGEMPWRGIIVIAFASGLMMASGLFLGKSISAYIPATFGSYLSATVFIVFGFWFLKEGTLNKGGMKYRGGITDMSWGTSITLGLALGINSIALGVSAGIIGFPPFFTSILTASISFLFVWSGSHLGTSLAEWIGHHSNQVAGIILLLIAIFELWQLI